MNSKTLLRLLALLLAAAMLSGCAARQPETAAPDGAGTGAASDPAPDAPETPDQTLDAPTVTAGGVAVRTDYANYVPYAAPEAVYTRLSPDWIADLKASDGYGALYPFRGATLYSEAGWESGARYGFFDASGRIVADPTYTTVRRLTEYVSGGKALQTPYWLLGRSSEVQQVETEDGQSYLDGQERYAVAAADGSFVTDCVYGYVTPVGENVLCMKSWADEAFTVYAPDGTVLLTEGDIGFADRRPPDGWFLRSGGDGFLLVSLTDGDYFVDENGRLALGPYDYAEPFSGGLAAVTYDGLTYGVIDRDGNEFLPAQFTAVRTDCDGGVIACDSERHRAVLFSRTGDVIFETDGDYMAQEAYGYSVRLWDEGIMRCLDADGELLYTLSDGGASVVYGTPYLVREEAGGLTLENLVTGAQAGFPDASTVSPVYGDLLGGELSDLPYLFLFSYDDPDAPARLLDAELNVLLELAPGTWVTALTDGQTGEEYVLAQADGRYTVYDSSLNELARTTASPTVCGGLIFTTDGRATTAQEPGGAVRFRYLLTTSMDD